MSKELKSLEGLLNGVPVGPQAQWKMVARVNSLRHIIIEHIAKAEMYFEAEKVDSFLPLTNSHNISDVYDKYIEVWKATTEESWSRALGDTDLGSNLYKAFQKLPNGTYLEAFKENPESIKSIENLWLGECLGDTAIYIGKKALISKSQKDKEKQILKDMNKLRIESIKEKANRPRYRKAKR